MFASLRQNWGQSIATAIVSVLCIAGILTLQLPEVNQQKKDLETLSLQEINRQVKAEQTQIELLKQLPTFGFDNLISDWAYLQFAEYFGDQEAREKTDYKLSPEYFDLILDRDPRFLEAYFLFSVSTSLYAAMPEKTVEVMEEKLQILSPKDPDRAYYIWRYKGTDELLFLGDAEAAQKSFAKAAEWASVYSDEEAERVEKASRQTAEFLAKNPASKSAQINAWRIVLGYATGEQAQQSIINRIEELGGKVSVDEQGQLQVTLPEED